MEDEATELQKSTEQAEAKQEKRRGPRPLILAQSQAKKIHIWLPAICTPAVYRIRNELGFRSCGDAIQWLVHQVRPELVPAPKQPSKTHSNPTKDTVDDSVPKLSCMANPDGDTPISDFPVTTAGGPESRSLVRATVVQASSVFFDTPATIDKAEKLIALAAAYGSQLVVFPEAFVGGYPRCVKFDAITASNSTQTDADFQKYHDSAIDIPGPEVDRLANIAGKYKVQLVMGVVERAGFYLYSTLLFFNSLGQLLGQHRKLTQMASEQAVWYSGEKSSALPIFETPIGKIGGLICWDNKWPLLRTELYDKGVEIYCAPTAEAEEIWKASMTHIALEGGCFVLSANQFCTRRDYPVPTGDSNGDASSDAVLCAGGSMIISPSGTILAGPNYQGECLISADLDLREISQAKTLFRRVERDVAQNHVTVAENRPTPILLSTEMKTKSLEELSV